MTKDLESMKEVGINNLVFLEVGIGVPRGHIDFMSKEWHDLYVYAVREAKRLGIKILLGAGPGWCESGGPWVKAEESMKHLVFSETEIEGNKKVDIGLPIPEQRSTEWHKMKDTYYEDVAVYAITNSAVPVIADINEKALYERDPYSSKPNVKPFLPSLASYDEPEKSKILEHSEILDVTEYLQANGHLVWEAPKGKCTIIRIGKRVTGASSRPAPEPAIGLESNKMDTLAFRNHLKNFTDILLEKTAPRKEGVGWTGFHIDSWESGAQNWTEGIAGLFIVCLMFICCMPKRVSKLAVLMMRQEPISTKFVKGPEMPGLHICQPIVLIFLHILKEFLPISQVQLQVMHF